MALGRQVPPSFLHARKTVLGRILRLHPAQKLVARRFTRQ
ncbi:hypothetical protein ART_4187 [Arthrobacter sp. PAMC 25486]|nr:hypothetical protein ART_4187 [Arthrobacter sp. PAMC 25486]